MSIADILKTAGVVLITAMSQMSGIIDSSKNGKAAVVNVYSEFCGYSQQMAKTYAKYVPLNAGKSIDFYGVDANEVEDVTGSYNIRGVPVFIGFACGKELGRVTGADESGLFDLLTKLGNSKC